MLRLSPKTSLFCSQADINIIWGGCATWWVGGPQELLSVKIGLSIHNMQYPKSPSPKKKLKMFTKLPPLKCVVLKTYHVS